MKRENDNKIKFWSTIPGIEETAPIRPAREFIPKWWKSTPAHKLASEQVMPPGGQHIVRDGNQINYSAGNETRDDPGISEEDKTRSTGTIKLCPAIHDWFDMGWVLPMWCDIHIELFEDGKLGESGGKPYNIRTPHSQFRAGLMDNIVYNHWLPKEQQKNQAVGFINMTCPWQMVTPPGVSVFQFPMWWHFNQDFEVPPGPVWSDIYTQVNPQIIVKHYGKITIKRGTPLCVFIPFARNAIEDLEMEIVPRDEECKRLESKTNNMVQTVFRGGYRQEQKKELDAKAAGCPFPHEHIQ